MGVDEKDATEWTGPASGPVASGPREGVESELPELAHALETVLFVDDDVLIRAAIRRPLERGGYVVTLAQSGEEALDAIERQEFDLIITDINMPRMSGIELLERVRERDPLVSVVILTGNPDAASAARAAELGAMHYLIKPVDTTQLLSFVHRAVRMTRLARLQRWGSPVSGGRALGSTPQRLGRDAQLAKALQSLWLAHQPIVSAVDHSLVGFEALMRFDDPLLPGPLQLIELAQQCGRLPVVGRTVRQRAASSLNALPPDGLLFVNLHGSDLADPYLRDPGTALSQVASRVVLEVTERASIDRIPEVGTIAAELRAMGFRLAVDDLGSGYSGLSSLTLLQPEFVKVDMGLVRDIDSAPAKRAIVAGIIRLAQELGMTVISEGVETEAECQVVTELGSHWLQGYWIGRPASEPQWPQWRPTAAGVEAS